MEKTTEVWQEVPETQGRYWISNKGHLKQMGVKQRRGKNSIVIFKNETKPVIADYKTGRLGWYASVDNIKMFIERDIMLTGFEGIPVEINPLEDAVAQKRREDSYRPDLQRAQEAAM